MYLTGQWKSLSIVSIVLYLLSAPLLVAEPVRMEQARKVTESFLAERGAPPSKAEKGLRTAAAAVPDVVNVREIPDDEGGVLAYVAELAPHGFVATSADTDITPIIAYSFKNPFPAQDDANPLYRMLREDLTLRAQALAEYREEATENHLLWDVSAQQGPPAPGVQTFRQWPEEGATATGGWLQTAWDQDTPYNDLCPLDPVDGKRSYVGCVATALAQLLNYHQKCSASFGPVDAYTSDMGIDVDVDSDRYDFPSFSELNTYLAAIGSKYSAGTALDDTDVAALSFACGIALEMDYSSEGSGAYSTDLRDSLLDKFGFYSAEIIGGLSSTFYPVLQENLMNGLPVFFSIRAADGFIGHVIICDGYNTDGEYHLNFGWGTERPEIMTEAWYRLPTEVPSQLNIVRDTILNIRPDRANIEVEPTALLFHGLPGEESDPQVLRIRGNAAGASVQSISSCEGFLVAGSDGVYANQIDSFETGAPGQEELVHVKFGPDRAGGYHGILKIDCDDGETRHVILDGCSFGGGTVVPAGEVSGRWSKAESPYFVSGDIAVAEGGVLMIEPGVQVMFAGSYSMTVGWKARLMALGNEAGPIELTAWNEEMGWAGLRFVDSGNDDILRHCAIAFAKKRAGPVTDPDEEADMDAPAPGDVNECGGAVYCYLSDPTIANCRITNNAAAKGGAIHCDSSSPVIVNTVIANNLSTGQFPQCGGICSDIGGTVRVENCTIVNNSPGGLYDASWDGMTVTNTIVWGNKIYQMTTYESTPTVSFCDVQGGYRGDGNIDADPCFFAPSSGAGSDYDGAAAIWTLTGDSPCINAGTQIDLPAKDLAGSPRVYSNVVDLGAYENQSELPLITVMPSVTVDAGFVRVDANSIRSFEISNTGQVDVEIERLSLSDANGVFSLVASVADRVLPPGDSVPVEIAFTPAQEMNYAGTLYVHSSSSNGPAKPISLSGTGVLGTVVPAGPVSGAWVKAESPYAITGDIYVPVGRSLTIEPGVLVKFAGHFGLTVGYQATLDATGTKDEPIVFTARDTDEGWYGIRFVNTEDDDVLEHCTIEYAKKTYTEGGDYLNVMGGAILCCGSLDQAPGFYVPSSPKIERCLITKNSAVSGGAIVLTDYSEAVITNCRIVDNSADIYAAGILILGAYGTVANNVIAHNSGLIGGGIVNWYALPSISNNTIVQNRPNGLHLEATEMSFWGAVPIVHNIIWQNELYVEESVRASEYVIRFNDIQGGWRGRGNIDVDPLFADPENRDYHLRSKTGRWEPNTSSWVKDDVTSPCIDAGDPASPVSKEPAPHGNRINLGAYGGTTEASKSP